MDARPCKICGGNDSDGLMLQCDICNLPYHATCVGFEGPLEGDWLCLQCQLAEDESDEDEEDEVQDDSGKVSASA